MDLLVIVPHYDDAVLSLGAHLEVWARSSSIHVATCFGAAPLEEHSTPFDRASGFADSTEAVRGRWLENEEALLELGVLSQSAGPFCDWQYDQPAEPTEVVAWIHGLIGMVDPSAVVSLLGLHHVDHKLLAEAVLCCDSAVYDRFVAEDLPYRVLWPREVPVALERSNARYMVTEVRSSVVKERAVAHYGSQLWSLSLPTLLVPERVWSVD